MRARAILALALNGFRESRRNRVTVVVFAFAFAMIFLATFALGFTVATFERVLTDVGLGVMGIITAVLTVFLGVGLIPKEIERRTIFMIVSKPIRRSDFILGRYLGNVLTIYAIVAMMAVLFYAQVLVEGAPLRASHVVAAFGLMLEATLLSAVAFAFAAWSSQFVAGVATIGLYFLGHMAGDLFRMAERQTEPFAKLVMKGMYYVLPNLGRLDFKLRATYDDATSAAELLGATTYTLAYTALLLTIACLTFERRDFK